MVRTLIGLAPLVVEIGYPPGLVSSAMSARARYGNARDAHKAPALAVHPNEGIAVDVGNLQAYSLFNTLATGQDKPSQDRTFETRHVGDQLPVPAHLVHRERPLVRPVELAQAPRLRHRVVEDAQGLEGQANPVKCLARSSRIDGEKYRSGVITRQPNKAKHDFEETAG